MPPVADSITFAGGVLDRVADRRADAAWVQMARDDPRARAVVAGPRGVGLEPAAAERPRPALVRLDDREPVLLGVDGDGVPLWAVEARDDEATTNLRDVAPLLSDADAGLLAYAQQLLHWRATHRFCGTCGSPTQAREAGHVRGCARGHVAHPRTDPVVIMLVADGVGDRLLLGRQASWPPGRYSALAGFVEPGESLEAAVAREVLEEVGVQVRDIRYRGSQPWPFPASLMLGFEAAWAGGDVVVAEAELEDARWFGREQVREAADEAGADLRLPPPFAIARRLIDSWLTGT